MPVTFHFIHLLSHATFSQQRATTTSAASAPPGMASSAAAGGGAKATALPQGFFSDKVADAKARGQKIPDEKEK